MIETILHVLATWAGMAIGVWLWKNRMENEEDTSKWYNCAHCDAGYPDQECTCKENEE